MNEIKMGVGSRVEVPAWSDWWVSGARYGTVKRLFMRASVQIAEVKFDGGRNAKFYLEDLRPAPPVISIIDTEA